MAALRIISTFPKNKTQIAKVIREYTGAKKAIVYDLIDSAPTTITNLDPEEIYDFAEELRELACEVEEIV